ncbi:hypothetical protein [Caulobacter sp. LARHSG274]
MIAIRHIVMHNGRECGKIIYDSKNHNAWRNEFVTKLKADQELKGDADILKKIEEAEALLRSLRGALSS